MYHIYDENIYTYVPSFLSISHPKNSIFGFIVRSTTVC